MNPSRSLRPAAVEGAPPPAVAARRWRAAPLIAAAFILVGIALLVLALAGFGVTAGGV